MIAFVGKNNNEHHSAASPLSDSFKAIQGTKSTWRLEHIVRVDFSDTTASMSPSFINVAPLHGIAHHQLLFVRSDRRCEPVLTSLLPTHNSDIGIVKLWPYFF